jgi:hypothetical protein
MMPDRGDIERLDLARRNARLKLKADGADVREMLKPSAVFGRWKQRQVQKIASATKQGQYIAKKSAPFVGVAAIAALLYAGRKPIFNAVEKLRNKESQE